VNRRVLASAIAGLLALGLPLSATAAPGPWNTYQNARFGYSVAYPADLLAPLPEAANGDGRHFQPRRGHADVAVWAGYDATGQSLGALADEAEQGCVGGHASYRVVRDAKAPPFMAVSCARPGGAVFYTKALRCKDVTTEIEFTYPNTESATWDPVVARMSASLSAGCGAG
jgi:hypothetical protein